MMKSIVSIGYEKKSIPDLIRLLRQHRVAKLIDVRELPLSRRKGFSKTTLSVALNEAGIEYRHLRAAGNPHRAEKQNIEKCLRLYSNYLKKNPSILVSVTAEMSVTSVAFLCYEKEHDCCHRSVLIAELNRQGRRYRVVQA